MKQVLIIMLFEGSPRIEGLAKYLPEFNWQPIILTGITSKYTNLPSRVVETPEGDALGFLGRLLRVNPEEDARQQIYNRLGITSKNPLLDFFLSLAGEVINYPCPNKNWKPFALQAGNKLLQEEKIDAIVSSSVPVISHIVAQELKEKYKTPWLADFRDLWSQNHNYSYSRLRRRLDRRLELKTLAEADALITVSEPWAEKLRALHKGKPVYTIIHGFAPDYVNIPPAKLTGKFTITYTGTIYPGKQDPSKLFAALRDLLSDGTMNPNEIQVRFHCPKYDWLDKEIEEYGLADIVKQYGFVPRNVALGKQRESQLLLRLSWEGREEAGYSGKLFEYLAARRPILATGGSADVVSELLNETKAGICAMTIEDIKNTLKELYEEYKLKGKVVYKGEEAKVNKYTNRETARKFSQVLEQVTARKG